MKLKPRQIIGLGAIFIFGGILVFRLTQPSEREIMERRLASLPRIETPDIQLPIPDLQYTTPPSFSGVDAPVEPPNPEIDYATLGSQDARDDLYCGAVLSMEFDVMVETGSPDDASKLLAQAKALKGAGLAKLKSEGVSTGEDWAFFTLAHEDHVQSRHGREEYRITAVELAAPTVGEPYCRSCGRRGSQTSRAGVTLATPQNESGSRIS